MIVHRFDHPQHNTTQNSAPMHQARIDVPTSLGITSHKVRMVGKAEAVAVAVLAQAALTVNSLYTWLIYRLVSVVRRRG